LLIWLTRQKVLKLLLDDLHGLDREAMWGKCYNERVERRRNSHGGGTMDEIDPSSRLPLSRSRCWQHFFAPATPPSDAGSPPALPRLAQRASEAAATSDIVYTFDARHLYGLDLTLEGNRRRFHDELPLLTSLQGLVNR
jgi:hypothetical protein